MEKQDLAKLKIERSAKPAASNGFKKRYRRVLLQATLIGMTVLSYFFYAQMLSSGLPVEIGTVTTTYPSQALTLLNATGYVVPQTKTDVASNLGFGRVGIRKAKSYVPTGG